VRQQNVASAAAPVVALLIICGCSGRTTANPETTQTTQAAGLRFVVAPSGVAAKCRATARAVGYPVPCPTRLPAGLGPEVIGAGGVGGGAKSWRGWVVGSSNTDDQHLVITASPRPLTNYAKLVNGPAWYPKQRVRPLGWVRINGWKMRSVYVPPVTNDGSAFMHHVVLIWTEGGHTYGLGFHNTKGIRLTLHLDEELAKHIELVRP
jgi:hypothetical protein